MIKYAVIVLASFFTPFLLATPAHASVNDFYISNYDIQYQLSRDDDRRSTLKTTEIITAVFSNANKNHGIERAIPKTYAGHSTSLSISSVKDNSGKSLQYATSDSNDNLIIRIGNKNTYVHGSQTYVINYTQRDVTNAFKNTASDEFYWDTNGTEWKVPIHNLSINLKLEDGVAKQLTGRTACYQGKAGNSAGCTLESTEQGFTSFATTLASGQNISFAIAFKPGTFAAYQASVAEMLFAAWLAVQAALLVIVIGLTVWLTVRYAHQSDRTHEHDPIVPEYLPPKDASIQVSESLTRSQSGFTAQIIDLAVRHYIKIIQTKEKKGIFGKNEYELEVIRSVDDLRREEIEILKDMFSAKPVVGSRLPLMNLKKDSKFYTRTLDNPKKLKKLIHGEYGLRAQNSAQSAWFKKFAVISVISGILLLSPSLLVLASVAFGLGHTLRPLTDSGLALLRYLKGLKLYISVAEEERLKMLQSPEGAAKAQINGSDTRQLVKLYERVLPYAVLFGQEKEWNKQLGKYYEASASQPDWYSSTNNTLFNAAMFNSAMSSFSSTVGYTAPSSSSSGGSSGGGSSGGGGGGGGGGGW